MILSTQLGVFILLSIHIAASFGDHSISGAGLPYRFVTGLAAIGTYYVEVQCFLFGLIFAHFFSPLSGLVLEVVALILVSIYSGRILAWEMLGEIFVGLANRTASTL